MWAVISSLASCVRARRGLDCLVRTTQGTDCFSIFLFIGRRLGLHVEMTVDKSEDSEVPVQVRGSKEPWKQPTLISSCPF